ncbi:MAG: O-antigen ligase family protein [Actinomycetota bacterium]
MTSNTATGRPLAVDRLEMYGRYCVLALMFLVPVAFTQSTLNMFDLPKFVLLWVLGIAAFGISQARYFATRIRTPTLAVRLAVGLGILGVAASVASPYPVISTLGNYNRYGGLATQLLFLGVLIAIVRLYRADHRALDGIAAVSALAAGLIAGYTLVQAADLDWMQWPVLGETLSQHPHGTLGNSNYNGAYLGISLPFFVYLALISKKRLTRALVLTGAVLVCAALWQTWTRGGMLALAAGGTVMVLGLRKEVVSPLKMKARSKRTVLVFVLLFLTAAVAGGALITDRASRLLDSSSLAVRVGWWESSIQVIGDHPWLGTGFNTFYASVLPYGDQKDPSDRNLQTNFPDEPHNVFLSRAAGSGIPALLTYLLLVGSTGFFALRRARHLQRRERMRIITFTALLAAYLTQGFFSIDVIGVALMGWTALAALAAMSDPRLTHGSGTAVSGHGQGDWTHKRKVLTTITLTASTGLIGLGVPVVVADAQVRKAHEEPDGDRSVTFIQRAIEIHPLEPAYRFKLGKQLLLNAMANDDPGTAHLQFRRATEAYRKGLQLQPEMVHEMVNLTLAYSNWGVNNDNPRYFQIAEHWFRLASELDPIDYEIAYRRSENLRMWARTTGDTDIRKRQVAQLEHSISLYPDQAAAWVRLSAAHRALGRDEKADEILRERFGRVLEEERIRAIIEQQVHARPAAMRA